jgi:hypothetical protein
VRFSTRGVQKHHKKLFGKIHVKKFWPKKLRKKKLFPFHLFPWVFGRFSTRAVQKHHKKLFGESPCQKLILISRQEIIKTNELNSMYRFYMISYIYAWFLISR